MLYTHATLHFPRAAVVPALLSSKVSFATRDPEQMPVSRYATGLTEAATDYRFIQLLGSHSYHARCQQRGR